MIDDPAQVSALMRKMEQHLPIPVKATKDLERTLRDRGIKRSSLRSARIEKVTYMGDEGGIGCVLELPGQDEESVVASLTHLRLGSHHPLAREVRAYQRSRARNLARGQ